MAAEITLLNTNDFTSQIYEGQDVNLISTFDINTYLSSSSYIESFIYDNNQNILSSNYNFSEYTILNNGQSPDANNNIFQIEIKPEETLINSGYDQGQYITYYNFFNKQIGSEFQQLYISEISSDRTEVRLDSTSLTDIDIVEQASNLILQRENSLYFLDFYLNFGDNQLAIANNIQLDNQDPTNPTILIKLYEALPAKFNLNSTLWVVTNLEESIAYQVTFEDTPIIILDTVPLNNPNFNLDIKDQINNSSLSYNYSQLTSTSLTSSFNQLSSLLEEKEIDVNIDYTNFNNFTHFSSVKARLENFYYKVDLIEQYSASISTLNNTTNNNPNVSITIYEAKINDIITNFDGYDYYLYYTSGSWAWPKTTSQPPYLLDTVNSNAVLTWFGSNDETSPYYGGIILSASNFDNNNQNNLYYSIPEYLREDPANDPYQVFIEMVGQFYDNIWIYYKDVTEKYNADNRLENGVSKDIVADAIRDFGIKLYQNNFSNEDLYTAFLGLTPDGALFPFPNITGSLPTPSGYEYVDTLISASNDYIPLDDVNKSLYKRIYHNLPYLLKAKGTLPALRTLITSYGIPDTILRINEYGGKDKSNVNDWDYWQDTFNYAYYNTGSNIIQTEWPLNPIWGSEDNVPSTFMFRFKIPSLASVSSSITPTIIWKNSVDSILQLRYTGSGYTSGSYSGSIQDPYYQYAHLDFIPDIGLTPNNTASIYLPFCNEGWWSVMVTRHGSDFVLYAGNNIYEGGDNGTKLGFYSSSSVTAIPISYISSLDSSFSNINQPSYIQEIRYYNTPMKEDVFKDYIMNPSSTEGNSLNSSPNELVFRAALGGELFTGSVSIHPKVTGSWATTSSFPTNSDILFPFGIGQFVPNTEYFFLDQPAVGIKNAVSDKIRSENNVMPSGDTLSPFRSLSQQVAISQSYTANTNLLEVAFSPQDEINDDISSQIGYFNIGEFIGDPRLRSSSAQSYPDLDKLRNDYFEKYTSNYNFNDFIRLIKFFDNSLFKMIKDFVPARTSLASGIVIKQHLLERNKYPQPQANNHSTIAYGSSGSVNNTPFTLQDISVSGTVAPQWNDYNEGTIENFSGGTGGTMDMFNGLSTSPVGTMGVGPNNIFNITQSWIENIITPSGSTLVLHSAQDEFYDGEFSGSVLTVTTQSLFNPYPLDNQSFLYRPVYYYGNTVSEANTFQNNFLDANTSPHNGEILFDLDKQSTGLNVDIWSYIKIAKIDCSGSNNTNALGQIDTLLIETPLSGLGTYWIKYTLTVLNEYSNCYLYKINNAIISQYNTPAIYSSFIYPNQLFNYKVSSSITASYNVGNGSPKTIINWNSSLPGANLPHYGTPYFNTSSGILTFENTPNTQLTLTASITTSGSFTIGQSYPINLIQNRNNVENIISQQYYSTNGVTNVVLTASFYPIQNDQYYISLEKPGIGGNIDIKSGSLLLTQSRAVSASNCESVIFEPYITTANYYNSDYNPLINNIKDERLSSIYELVDYYPGITTPTNLNLILSGSALKAPVQDSNYSSKRNADPRYNGVKSTNQYLNVWTPGDTGTYGKTPSTQNLKTMVAYCDWIGGWPPDKMNASGIHVLYLIKSDGSIVIPNVSENSLFDNKGTFESGERLIIKPKTVSAGQPQQYRNIIRGGTRIEPILYTQIGHSPANWNTTMSFTTDFVTSLAIGNYIAKSSPSASSPIADGTFSGIDLNNNISLGAQASAWTSNYYTINQNIISENVSLTIKAQVQAGIKVNAYGAQNHYITFELVKDRAGVISILATKTKSIANSSYNTTSVTWDNIPIAYRFPSNFNLAWNLSPQDMQNGDKIYVRGKHETSTYGLTNGSPTDPSVYINKSNTSISIGQIPIITNTLVSSSGTNTIWGYPDNTKLYAITCSNATLNQFYNNGFTMNDITGSGFNSITLPWSIEYGDEFRFEGNEISTFMVKKAYDVGETDSNRVSPTGSIEVQFNALISTSSINLDHFVIRRYVDDASLILMEGYRPINSSGPYIVRPEYVVPELNKSVDEFILDLTQKGLIP
jgi:hypothetical protein